MTSQAKLGGIGIAVHNVDVMHGFYTNVLGLDGAPLPDGAHHFLVEVGGVTLAFFRTSGPKGMERTIPRFMANPSGMDHLRFTVADLSGLVDRLRAHGVRTESVEGMDDDVVRFSDPEGNLIGVQAY